MSPENQAENTTPSTEKTAKATPPKPSKPKSSVIQIHPEGERIHPKKAEGRFAKLRIAAVLATQFVFYVIPWFNWSGRQAVLFNIPDRHFFIFGLSLGMGDLIYLALLLMICAFGLFWWTTIAGRLWCGYSCPQTVYTEIMLWIDNLVEGDRNKRLKLEKSPWNFTKIRIKATKYPADFPCLRMDRYHFCRLVYPDPPICSRFIHRSSRRRRNVCCSILRIHDFLLCPHHARKSVSAYVSVCTFPKCNV